MTVHRREPTADLDKAKRKAEADSLIEQLKRVAPETAEAIDLAHNGPKEPQTWEEHVRYVLDEPIKSLFDATQKELGGLTIDGMMPFLFLQMTRNLNRISQK